MSEIYIKELIVARAEQDALYMLAHGLTEMANPYPPMTAAAIYWKKHFQEVLRSNGAPDSKGGC